MYVWRRTGKLTQGALWIATIDLLCVPQTAQTENFITAYTIALLWLSQDAGGESAKRKMKQQRRNLRSDTEAASEVIGVVLMMAVFVTMLTIFQASVVPYWNKQVEAAEIQVTHDDMMFLPSYIEDVAIHETPKTCTVQLGAQYPDRMIFRNPGPGAFGTLTVEEVPVPITVRYNDGTNHTKPYNSTRITYEMSGTINSPKLVYEHGVIITDWGTVNLTTDNQTLIVNDNIYIPIVYGSSSSKSAIGTESIAIEPYEYLDTLGDISTVNVTLDTDYLELWNNTLLSPSVRANLDFSGTVEFGSDKIYINTSVPYLKLPNQTASGPLYAGMISCSLEDPDGGGGGSGLWVAGEGTDIMAIGSRVANIPSSANATAIVVQDIVVDEQQSLNTDFATIIVTDNDWNWWKVLIEFKETDSIKGLVVTNKGGSSSYYYNGNPVATGNLMPFTQSTVIDLFNPSNFGPTTDGLYQYAGVGSNNRLVTNIADNTLQKNLALVSFRLMFDDD
jgi:hypothetical protein